MVNKNDNRGAWCYLLSIAAFLVAAVAVMQLLQAGTSALASPPAQTGGGQVGKGQDSPLSPAAVPAVQEGFELGALNTTQFQNAIPTCVPGGCGWNVATDSAHGGAYSVFGPDVNNTSDQQLVLNNPVSIPSDATSASLTFWQHFSFERYGVHYYDGGVLEFSTNGGTDWVDGGNLITSGQYNVTLEMTTTNPLQGRPGWGGTLSNWTQVQVNLLTYKGTDVLFRLRAGTDNSNFGIGAAGWWADDFTLTFVATSPCSPAGWLQATPYPTIMADVAAVEHGGQVYTFGGLNGIVNTVSYRYDPGGNTWTPIADLPSARYYASAASDGTYMYVLGGRDSAINPVNTVYRYNPTTNSYTTLSSMSAPLFNVASIVLAGKLYRIGGQDASALTNSAEAYSLTTHTWSSIAPVPQSSAGAAIMADGTYLYIAGGLTGVGGATAKTYRYDPNTNTWNDAAIADLPLARAAMASAFYDGRWMLAGGLSNATGYLSSVLAWEPATNRWSSRAQLPRPLGSAAGVSAGGHFYTIAGVDEGSYIRATVRVYSEGACPPPTATPTSCPIQFTDVAQGSTFYAYIRCLACRSIVSGYTNNPPCTTGVPCFLPGNNVTRGQMAKFVSNAANFQDVIPPNQQTFTDVPPNSTFWLFVERAYLHGVINGYTANPPCSTGTPCFLPGNNVTRGQAAKFVSIAAGYSEVIPPNQQTFTDVVPNSTFWVYIERVYLHSVISGYTSSPPCTTGTPCFQEANNVTRGQTAKFISNAFFPGCQTPSGIRP